MDKMFHEPPHFLFHGNVFSILLHGKRISAAFPKISCIFQLLREKTMPQPIIETAKKLDILSLFLENSYTNIPLMNPTTVAGNKSQYKRTHANPNDSPFLLPIL